jgi:hypothetical protein
MQPVFLEKREVIFSVLLNETVDRAINDGGAINYFATYKQKYVNGCLDIYPHCTIAK